MVLGVRPIPSFRDKVSIFVVNKEVECLQELPFDHFEFFLSKRVISVEGTHQSIIDTVLSDNLLSLAIHTILGVKTAPCLAQFKSFRMFLCLGIQSQL